MLDRTTVSKVRQFNTKGPKVSTRRARKAFGRDSLQGCGSKEYELNYRTGSHAVSLANLESIYAGEPVVVP